MNKLADHMITCYHCGETTKTSAALLFDEKKFCCSGCSMVYQLLQKNNLCAYYAYNKQPGANMEGITPTAAFAVLDEPELAKPFIYFSNQEQTDISFYLPQIHCSSCLWLLEHLHQLNEAVLSSTVDFPGKQVYIQFDHKKMSARQVAELLAAIGYSPDLHSSSNTSKQHNRISKRRDILELGIAGFCFSNIMMLSFPEYLGLDSFINGGLSPLLFRTINFVLAIPALVYSGRSFFINAWQGLQRGKINIDIPIALALCVTFFRSIYEIMSGIGGGYLDSLSGIIFFMLAGRFLQRKVAPSVQLNRQVSDYFPIAVAKLGAFGNEQYTKVEALQVGDIIRIHTGEIIPVDTDLLRGKAVIDYSFVTGESMQYQASTGTVLYAGGKQCAGTIDLRILKPFSLAAFSRLWNTNKRRVSSENENKFIELISKYFSLFVLLLAFGTWVSHTLFQVSDPWGASTAVLIVACPCGLLLTSSFTYGFITAMFSRKGFYMRNGSVLQQIAETTDIIFDKTGTLTTLQQCPLRYEGSTLSEYQLAVISGMAKNSLHPLSKKLAQTLSAHTIQPEHLKEYIGYGVEAWHNDTHYKIGSSSFVGVEEIPALQQTMIFVSIDSVVIGKFLLDQRFREGVQPMLATLPYPITVLSGDDAISSSLFSDKAYLKIATYFKQTPADKYRFVQQMESVGKRVMMIGDGLNDAGALAESNTGIAVVENTLQFSPASDAIMHVSSLPYLHNYLLAAKQAQRLIIAVFALSIAYNLVGLYFAVTAQLVPVIAAILMPLSTLTIVLSTLLGSTIIYNRFLKKIPNL